MINRKRVGTHLLFWSCTGVLLWAVIASGSPDKVMILKFVGLLMPITIGTSYIVNYYLIDRILLKKKYVEFTIHGAFVFVFSIYLQTLLVMYAFASLADYSYANIGPVATNVTYLGISTYFVIFLSALIFTLRQQFPGEEEAQSPVPTETISVVSNRKTHLLDPQEILYIESLGNYVKVHMAENSLVTKEKISKLQERLPEQFLRIHRSFLVNRKHVQSFGKEHLVVGNQELNISRTYKKAVSSALLMHQSMS